MTQAPLPGQMPSARPTPNIYTALIMIAIAAMAVSLVVVLIQLLSPNGYNLQFGDLFGGLTGAK